jgi:L-asparagine transporter-like permease
VPWSGKLCIGRILETGTNWAGAGLLAALLAVDLIAAALLMTGWPSSLWSWLAAIGALALAVTYNYLVTEYLSETAGG